ncbi:hypothetical protein [Pseudacidovorax sp. RU35E]|uniref:hypothetical protein n=1 Tax=Pseudacidovorax sp. RU35E TaxID=1907403 RepID=UPI000953CB18|nr:hypothetical protein [Pseudacidovorax sp. RU35E]SIR06394.1 hypothetical protein SAMN05880557_107289 [Pseudacidovorax sp. RU35E]
MTPEQKSFQAALAERLRERARTQLSGETQVLKQLAQARASILSILAGLPSDYQQWQLSRLLGQINDVIDGATTQAGVLFDSTARAIWQQGEDFIDKPLAVIGRAVELQLPLLDTRVLTAMRSFGQLRLKDVGREATSKIGAQLSQVTIGAQPVQDAVRAIQAQLAGPTPVRATTIVRTEVGRVFAVASEDRLEQAADLVPDLQKQWRRSAKIHSRWTHDLMDGQVVGAKESFKVPNPGGGFDMMKCPHDPQAPAEQVINCGCVMLPTMKGWQVMTPGAKPFTKKELQQDGRKAALDQAAKRAGRRQETA